MTATASAIAVSTGTMPEAFLYRVDLGGCCKTFVTAAVKDGQETMTAAFAFCSPTDIFDPEKTRAALGRLVGQHGRKHREDTPSPVHVVLDKALLKGETAAEKVLDFLRRRMPVKRLYSRKNHSVYGLQEDPEKGVLAIQGRVRIPEWFLERQRVSFIAKMQP